MISLQNAINFASGLLELLQMYEQMSCKRALGKLLCQNLVDSSFTLI